MKNQLTLLKRLSKYGNAYKKDKENASASLFGADSAMEIATPNPEYCEPWSKLDKLNHEKDVVGFYVSGHPLEEYRTALKTLKIQTMDNLEAFDRQEINIAGVVSGKNVRASKNGNMFTRFLLEDFKSNMEIALFGKDHEEFTDLVEDNQLVMITGKVQKSFRDEGKYEIRVTKIQNLEEMKEVHCKGVEVKVNIQILNEELINHIEKIVTQYTGEHTLKLKLLDFQEELSVDLTSKKYKIQLSDGLVNRLEDMGLECKMVY